MKPTVRNVKNFYLIEFLLQYYFYYNNLALNYYYYHKIVLPSCHDTKFSLYISLVKLTVKNSFTRLSRYNIAPLFQPSETVCKKYQAAMIQYSICIYGLTVQYISVCAHMIQYLIFISSW